MLEVGALTVICRKERLNSNKGVQTLNLLGPPATLHGGVTITASTRREGSWCNNKKGFGGATTGKSSAWALRLFGQAI